MKPIAKKPRAAFTEQQFDDLCAWIESHLDQPIGWQQLFDQSALDFEEIQKLFYQHAGTTPMTWIRTRREAKKPGAM